MRNSPVQIDIVVTFEAELATDCLRRNLNADLKSLGSVRFVKAKDDHYCGVGTRPETLLIGAQWEES